MVTGVEVVAPKFLLLVDRVISLIRVRKTRKRERFEKIIDPLYTEFVPLGEDLLALFREAKKSLGGTKQQRKAAFKKLQAQRDRFADSRARLRALANACGSTMAKKDPPVSGFVNSLASFFMPVAWYSDSPPKTAGANLVEKFSSFEQSLEAAGRNPEYSKDRLEYFISESIAHLERSWYEIAGRYMELKLKHTVE